MRTSTICFCPFILTATIPAPADASTVTELTCRCQSSCSLPNRESICWMAPTSIKNPSCRTSLFLLPRSHFRDFTTESLEHRPHHWVALELRAQFLTARRGRRHCGDRIKSSTDSHGTAQHVARNGTDPFERLAPFDHLRERPLLRRKINPQLGAFQFPAAAVLHEFAEKFLLRLDGALDLRHLFLGNAADAKRFFAAIRRLDFRSRGRCCILGGSGSGELLSEALCHHFRRRRE